MEHKLSSKVRKTLDKITSIAVNSCFKKEYLQNLDTKLKEPKNDFLTPWFSESQ